MIDRSDICTLVPAAGKGSRLGGDCPKVFTPIIGEKTIWDIINHKLNKISDNHCLVLNSNSYNVYKNKLDKKVHIAIQDNPIGMGDAIFKGHEFWSNYKYIIIVWGDQVHISEKTLENVIESIDDNLPNQIVLPVVRQESPYVEYIFSKNKLVQINQQREGDTTKPWGLSDLGIFCLSVKGLEASWSEYIGSQSLGKETGEINFLPFLKFLSCEKDWSVKQVKVSDADESRGINTPDDLEYFRELYSKDKGK